MAELSKMESDARDLFMHVESQPEVQPDDICVCNVFLAKWAMALPMDRIQKISEAIEDFGAPGDLKKAVGRFVKSGILRRRKIAGVMHYEINFAKDYWE